MSDFPFKKGDLITVKSSFQHIGRDGVIVKVLEDGWFDILIDGKVELIHKNYLVTPKIKAVKMTGGIK